MTSENPNQPLIGKLQDALRQTLRELAPRVRSYALLDFPNHSNVGDSAIYLGELVLLEQLYGRRPDFVAETSVEGLRRKIKPGEGRVIFLHGGGNFGDVWPAHQDFRDCVIQQFPNHRIVQLPQTLHFSDGQALRRSAEIVNRHSDFHLLVRDQRSFEIAKGHFSCPVHLCPDSAFMLGQLTPPVLTGPHVLFLLRTDKESAGLARDLIQQTMPTARVEDWIGESSVKTRLQRQRARLQTRLPAVEPLMRAFREGDYRLWANRRVERGLRQLSAAKVVVTDRLHAHILSILLAKPHIVLDNSYGKVSAFIDAWTRGGAFMEAQTLDEATDLAASYSV